METTLVTAIFPQEVKLNAMQARIISHGWISDTDKVQRIADSDGRSFKEIQKDGVCGMIGEWNAYLYFTSLGKKCLKPNCSILKRDAKIWSNDLIFQEEIQISNASDEIVTVDSAASCKAQFVSQTHRIRDTEPSWLFQIEAKGHDGYMRKGDPMLKDGSLSKLLIVSWIDDRWGGETQYVHHAKPGKMYKEGFQWRSGVAFFWWPDVFPYLSEPRKDSLKFLKKALYWSDIKHLQSEIITNDIQ